MSVTITRDTATPALAQIHDALTPARRKPLMAALGTETEVQYRRWFRGRNEDSPNRMGWPRQNFWSGIAKRTNYDPAQTTADRAVVVIAHPAINAKVHGGTWGAKESTYIAIPLRGDVYGKRPKQHTIPGLRFIPSQRGGNTAGWLAADQDKQTVYYWRLQRTITVSPDPRALPPKANVMAALQARALRFFFRPQKSAPSA